MCDGCDQIVRMNLTFLDIMRLFFITINGNIRIFAAVLENINLIKKQCEA